MGLGRHMNAKWNPKCGSELMDFLNKVLLHLMRCLFWIGRSFYLWFEEFWCNLLIAIDETYLKEYYTSI